jgi:hypothetical protein
MVARAAFAPQSQGDDPGPHTSAGCGGVDVEPSVAAAAANGLGDEATGALAIRADQALVAGLHHSTRAACATTTTEADTNGPAAGASARPTGNDVEAAIAAATADGLGDKT